MVAQAKLKSRYEIKETLGQGGMGVVYKAYDTVIRRDVAIKTIRDIPDPAALEIFHKECGVLASMAHPNIVEIFDLGEFEDNGANKPYFVMPLLPGSTLDQLIASSSQRLSVDRVVFIVRQICRGLQAAHERGLVHRDLKPSNVFVMEDDSVKIIDFGVAHIMDARTTMSLKGTLFYMAPEQLEMKPLSALSDLFSLGVVAYEALTLRRPFQGRTQAELVEGILHEIPPPVSEFNPAVNQAVSRVVHKAMAKQPWHRFASARELADVLSKASRNEAIEMFDPSRIQPRIDRARRAYEQNDCQFASEIIGELEAEGHLDPAIASLRMQIHQTTRQRTIHQLLQSARTRLEEREYPLALQKLQEVLQMDPANAEALSLSSAAESRRTDDKIEDWFQLARQHVDHYDFSHAREALNNVLQLRPNKTTALQLLSEVSRREQEYLRVRQQKQELYQSALAVWKNGEVSVALSKLQQVMELDERAPDVSAPEGGALYQNFYNQVCSEHDEINNAYSEARTHLAERDFTSAMALCDRFLSKYPNHALFQALKFDVDEQQRQEVSGQILEVNRRVEAEPDLDRRVAILTEAAERFPGDAYFQPALRSMKDKRDLVNSIVAKARLSEEQGQHSEALAQWEILRTIYGQFPGISVEIDRVVKRRELQARSAAKARWVEQVDLHLESSEYARAQELLEEAQSEFPADAELAELERLVRNGLEKSSQAAELLRQGQELCAGGDFAEGLDILERAHQMDDRNPVIRAVLVNALVEQGRLLLDTDWRAAEPHIQRALDLDPASNAALSLRTLASDSRREEFVSRRLSQARQAQASGDLKAAVSLVEEGLATYPNDFRMAQLLATLSKGVDESRRRSLEELKYLSRDSSTLTDPELFKMTLGRAKAIAARYPEDSEFRTITSLLEERQLNLAATLIVEPQDRSLPVPEDQGLAETLVQPAEGSVSEGPSQPQAQAPEPETPETLPDGGALLQVASVPSGVNPLAEEDSSQAETAQGNLSKPAAQRRIFWAGLMVAAVVMAVALTWMWSRQRVNSVAADLISLEVSTDPPGASIAVDGQPRGTSNLKIELSAGTHTVTAELEGYETATASADMTQGNPETSLRLHLQETATRSPTDVGEISAPAPVAPLEDKAIQQPHRQVVAKAVVPREEISLVPRQGVLMLKRTPANTQVSLSSSTNPVPRLTSEDRLDLLEGDYVLTATAPGYSKLTIPAKVVGGKTVEAVLNLQPAKETPQDWKELWEYPEGWAVEGDWLVRKGGNFFLSSLPAKAGTYSLTLWRKSKAARWVVNYQDDKDYFLFEMESKALSRTVVRDGKRGYEIKIPHALEGQTTYSLQVVVTDNEIIHRVHDGKKWITLDDLRLPASGKGLGKFGLYVPGRDEVGLSRFSFKPL